MIDGHDNKYSSKQKTSIVIISIVFLIGGFGIGTTYEKSILIPSDKELNQLTIMQYYPSPELLVKALNDNQITCKNLPLNIQKMVNEVQGGICNEQH